MRACQMNNQQRKDRFITAKTTASSLASFP
jgi:hypothetical protein